MKDNRKNFREASDLVLENIHVTAELKRKTMEKCTQKRIFKIKPVMAAALSAAVIISFGTYTYFYHRPAVTDNHAAKSINQEYKNLPENENKIQEAVKTEESPKAQEVPKVASSNASGNSESITSKDKNNIKNNIKNDIKENKPAVQDSKSMPQNKSNDAAEKKDTVKLPDNIPQSGTNSINDEKLELASQTPSCLATASEPLTVEKAEKFFESKIMLPSYLPEGFKQTDISIPDDKIKCVKLEYSSNSANFEILQSKSLSKLEGTKSITIENYRAYISSTKDEKTKIVTTKITWINNNIQYSLYGSLTEDSLIKIAKSIKY